MSSTNRILLVISIVLSGAAACAAVMALASAPVAGEHDGGAATLAELTAMRQRIDDLEREVEQVRSAARRLPALQAAAPSSSRDGEELVEAPKELAKRLDSIERVLAKTKRDPEAQDGAADEAAWVSAVRKDEIKGILEEVEAEERAQQLEEMRQREEERIRERITELGASLQLNKDQGDALFRIFTDEANARRELFGAGGGRGFGGFRGGDDGSRTDMREKMTQIRQTRDDQLARTLSSWQLEELKKIEDEDPFGFGRGNRGGGRRNSGDRTNRE